jgi:hypothetical protein
MNVKSLNPSLLILVPIAVLSILSCTLLGGFDDKRLNYSISSRKLPFPIADYHSLVYIGHNLTAWVSNDLNMWSYATEEKGIERIMLPEDPTCGPRTEYVIPESLGGERIQFWKLCRMEDKTDTYLVVYDWQTGKIEDIAGPLPLGSSRASWNPDVTRAIVYLDSGFARKTLFWIWKGGFGPASIDIGDKVQSWNLENFFPDFPDDVTDKTGNTGHAAWSPDGRFIALFASPNAIGKTGSDRFYTEYYLYLMDSDQLKPYPVLDKIHFPYILRWSYNSRYIAFIGQYGPFKEDGLWLYSLETDSLVEIAKGNFRDIAWSPNGEHLIAIRCDDKYFCSQIDEYDLSQVIE